MKQEEERGAFFVRERANTWNNTAESTTTDKTSSSKVIISKEGREKGV